MIDYGLGISRHGVAHAARLREIVDEVAPMAAPLWCDIAAEAPLNDGIGLPIARSRLINGGIASRYAWQWGAPRTELVGSMNGDYPHLRYETVETFWDTRITTLATNTTIGTSTTYTSESQSIFVGQTAERIFKACRVEYWFRTEWAATNSIIGWALTFQMGAGPTITLTQAVTAISVTSRNMAHLAVFDIPQAYLQQYFGTGSSAAAVVGITVSSTTAANINGITFKAMTTFGFAKSSATRTVTRRFPIQSQITSLTTGQQEIGTDGVSPAPANQIQAWDTYLPEASKTIHKVWLVLAANDGTYLAEAATTPYIQMDAIAEVARATIDRTIGTGHYWQDHYDISSLSTASAHSFNMRSSVASRMLMPGGFVYVTYSYNAATTTSAMYEALVPLTQHKDTDAVFDGQTNAVQFSGSGGSAMSDADKSVNFAIVDIQETNPVIKQSGVYGQIIGANAPTPQTMWCGDMGRRLVTNGTQTADTPFVVRGDDGTGAWSLVQGLNQLAFTSGNTASSVQGGPSRLVAVVNYTADVMDDPINGNHPVFYPQRQLDGLAQNNCDSTQDGEDQIRVQLGTPYRLTAVMFHSKPTLASIPNDRHRICLANLQGEFNSRGYSVGEAREHTAIAVAGTTRNDMSLTQLFNRDSLHTGKLEITTKRRQTIWNEANPLMNTWGFWITSHSVTFTVGGVVTIKGYPAPEGKSVQIFAYSVDGSGSAELIATVLTNSIGAFSATVLDCTRAYFSSYQNDGVFGRSELAVPV